MTDEMKIRCQLALAIVDVIWLAGKITDEERIRTKQIIPKKLEVIEKRKQLLKKYEKWVQVLSSHMDFAHFVSKSFSHLSKKAYFVSVIFY